MTTYYDAERDAGIEEELVLHVPCANSPTGKHPVRVFCLDGKVKSLTCGCPERQGESLHRLGAKTCWAFVQHARTHLTSVKPEGSYTRLNADGSRADLTTLPSLLRDAIGRCVARGDEARNHRACHKPRTDKRSLLCRLAQNFVSRLNVGLSLVVGCVDGEDTGRRDLVIVTTQGYHNYRYGDRVGSDHCLIRRIERSDGSWFWAVNAAGVKYHARALGIAGRECTVCPEHKDKQWDSVSQHARGAAHLQNITRRLERVVSALNNKRLVGLGG